MFEWDGDYLNPEDVETITTSEDELSAYPYVMRVTLRSGRIIGKSYKSEDCRNRETNRLAYEVARSKNKEDQVQLWQIERLIDKATAAIRRDIKKLRETIEKGQETG